MGSISVPVFLQYDPVRLGQMERCDYENLVIKLCAFCRLPVPSRKRIRVCGGNTVEVVLQCDDTNLRRVNEVSGTFSDKRDAFLDMGIIGISTGCRQLSHPSSRFIISSQPCDQDHGLVAGMKRPGSLRNYDPPQKRQRSFPGVAENWIPGPNVPPTNYYQSHVSIHQSTYALQEGYSWNPGLTPGRPLASNVQPYGVLRQPGHVPPPVRSLTDAEKKAIVAKAMAQGSGNQTWTSKAEPVKGLLCSPAEGQDEGNMGAIAGPSGSVSNTVQKPLRSETAHDDAKVATSIHPPPTDDSLKNLKRMSVPSDPMRSSNVSVSPVFRTSQSPNTSPKPLFTVAPLKSSRTTGFCSPPSATDMDNDSPSSKPDPSPESQTRSFIPHPTDVTIMAAPIQVSQGSGRQVLQPGEQATSGPSARESGPPVTTPQVASRGTIGVDPNSQSLSTPTLSAIPPSNLQPSPSNSALKFPAPQPAIHSFSLTVPQTLKEGLVDTTASKDLSQGIESKTHTIRLPSTTLSLPSSDNLAVKFQNNATLESTSSALACQLQTSPTLKNSICQSTMQSESILKEDIAVVCSAGSASDVHAVTLPISIPLQPSVSNGAMPRSTSDATNSQPDLRKDEDSHSVFTHSKEVPSESSVSVPLHPPTVGLKDSTKSPESRKDVITARLAPPLQDVTSSHVQSVPEEHSYDVTIDEASAPSVAENHDERRSPEPNSFLSPAGIVVSRCNSDASQDASTQIALCGEDVPNKGLISSGNKVGPVLRTVFPSVARISATPPASPSGSEGLRSPLFTPDPSSPLSVTLRDRRDVVPRDQVMQEDEIVSTTMTTISIPQDSTMTLGLINRQQSGPPINGVSDATNFDTHSPSQSYIRESLKRPHSKVTPAALEDLSILPNPRKKSRMESDDAGRPSADGDVSGSEGEQIARIVKSDPEQSISAGSRDVQSRVWDMRAQSETWCSDIHTENGLFAIASQKDNDHHTAYAALTMHGLKSMKTWISAQCGDVDLVEKVERLISILRIMNADPDVAMAADRMVLKQRIEHLERECRRAEERCKSVNALNTRYHSELTGMKKQLAEENTLVAKKAVDCRQTGCAKLAASNSQRQSTSNQLSKDDAHRAGRVTENLASLFAEKEALKRSFEAKGTPWEQLQLRLEVRKQKGEADLSSCLEKRDLLQTELSNERANNVALRAKLDVEKSKRISAEQEVAAVRQECKQPFVVPALLDTFLSLSKQAHCDL